MDWLLLDGKTLLHLERELLETLTQCAQHGPRKPEAGGLLIGHFPLEASRMVVDRCSLPQPEDRAGRTWFKRSQLGHQRVLDTEWVMSGQRRTYLGEWHTHPEAVPTPSSVDRRDWRGHLEQVGFVGDTLIFIIVGTGQVRVWCGARGQKGFDLLGQVCTGGFDAKFSR